MKPCIIYHIYACDTRQSLIKTTILEFGMQENIHDFVVNKYRNPLRNTSKQGFKRCVSCFFY